MPKGEYPIEKRKGLFKKGHKTNIGIKHSKSWNEKVGLGNKGKIISEEQKEKLRKYTGKLHWNWQGGISNDLSHYSRKRRASKIIAGGNHTLTDWETLKAQYNWTCPFFKKKKRGSNNIENIQPLCGSCNSKKYTKIIKYE